jgi:hypothetical protein
MVKKFLPVLILPLLLAGCATPFVATNLTPLQQIRTTNNLYTVEVAVASRQETLRWQSVHPQIVVGNEFYKMHPTMLMTNRFEGVIPVAPGTTTLHYHYKFDFDYNAWGQPKTDSAISPEYTMRILEQ